MKKIIFIFIAAGLAFSSASAQSAHPWKEYNNLLEQTYQRLDTATNRDAVIEEYVEQAYPILINNIHHPETDSIIMDYFYMLTPERKAEVVSLVAPERWKSDETLNKIYTRYQAELLTSAGKHYIDVQALTEDNKEVKLSELVGQADYLLVDFWASWCRPCRMLIPHVKELYAKYHASGRLDVVGISIDASRKDWTKALKQEQMEWLQLFDTGEEPHNPRVTYGITAIPTTLLIDRNGTIVLRNPSEEEIEELLNK